MYILYLQQSPSQYRSRMIIVTGFGVEASIRDPERRPESRVGDDRGRCPDSERVAVPVHPVAELDKKSRGGRSSIEHEQRLCFDYEKMLIHTVF